MSRMTLFSAVCLGIFLVGCGDSADGPDKGDSATTQKEVSNPDGVTQFVPQRPIKNYDHPEMAVRDFLTAVQQGDDKVATSLLTTAAQEEAWKNGMAISADGFPQAKFDVSNVEYVNNQAEAHVLSVWSDVTPDGQSKTFECVWLLEKEPHGWSVYGMATKFLENLEPIVLNFEDQADMMRKQQ